MLLSAEVSLQPRYIYFQGFPGQIEKHGAQRLRLSALSKRLRSVGTLMGHCTMRIRCTAVIILSLSPGGCCVSGNGCQVAAPATGTDWDGLSPSPSENEGAVSHPRVRPLKAAATRPKLQSNDPWEQQQAIDQADEARLRRKLMICRDCQAVQPRGDEATGSITR
jgi:hypothetical protein